VILVAVTIIVAGAYFPTAPIIGRFGYLLNADLPWILAAALGAAGLAATAIALAGKRMGVLLVLSVAIVVATGFVGYRYVSAAAQNGASYDIGRALRGTPPMPRPNDRVVFATVDGAELHADLWLPPGTDEAAPESLPAVVFVHGGSFISGGPGTRPFLLDALARAGVVGGDIEYRLSPPPRWNQAPGDVLCALAWMRSVDGLPMVDPDRIVLAGESAGGSLALMAGYAAGTDAIRSSCPDAGPAAKPAGVAAIAPAADLAGIWADGTIFDLQGHLVPEAYIGGTPTQYPDRYAAASPFRLFRAGLPPTLIVAAEGDRFVHMERITSIVDGIRAAGSACELVVAPFADHGFDGAPNSFGAQLVEPVITRFAKQVTGG
jgi:acetyl esterase/lipase